MHCKTKIGYKHKKAVRTTIIASLPEVSYKTVNLPVNINCAVKE